MPSWGTNHHKFSDDKIEYTAVPIELKEQAIEAMGDMSDVSVYLIAEVVVFTMPRHSAVRKNIGKWLNDNLIPYNYIYYTNNYSYWPDSRYTRRFTKNGENELQSTKPREDPTRPVAATLIHMLEGKGIDHETATRLAICYSIDTDWDNQVKFSRMHLMRKLMGSV